MLNLNVTVSGDKVVIAGLREFSAEMPKAINRGLSNVAKGTYGFAFKWLSGPGGVAKKKTLVGPIRGSKGFTKKSGEQVNFKVFQGAGSYPVPVRTGNLRSLLNWLQPGASKDGFTAGPMEVIIYDSALYASVIHDGTGSSAKFGKRPFLTDAFNQFNQGAGVAGAVEEEIQKEIDRKGLG
jgi:hypothetical protein